MAKGFASTPTWREEYLSPRSAPISSLPPRAIQLRCSSAMRLHRIDAQRRRDGQQGDERVRTVTDSRSIVVCRTSWVRVLGASALHGASVIASAEDPSPDRRARPQMGSDTAAFRACSDAQASRA